MASVMITISSSFRCVTCNDKISHHSELQQGQMIIFWRNLKIWVSLTAYITKTLGEDEDKHIGTA